jgi:glycosyltransferase involved in cell wall biosynthesis
MTSPSSITPKISVVLCTRNRGHRVLTCCEYLEKLSYPPDRWELLLVDNGSTDNTKAVLSQFIASTPINARYIFEPVAGVARAKNTGILAASGEIVAFTDDDCYVDPDWLVALDAAFLSDVDFVGGRVLRFREDTAMLSIQEFESEVTFGPGDFMTPGFIHGANMAFRQSVFHKVGLFDVRFGPGGALACGEDTEILVRILELGGTGVYAPTSAVYHDHDRVEPKAITKVYRIYSIGRGAFFAKMIITNPGELDAAQKYRKAWYNSTIDNFLKFRWRTIFNELQGAIKFLVMEIRHQ